MSKVESTRTDESARDAIRVAGDSLLSSLREGVDGRTLDQRLDRFCEIAFEALAPTGVSWLGFYRLTPTADAMTLVACRDRPACSPIGMHGVCGQAARLGRTRVVADVNELGPDYVACDPRDRSEIVIPLAAGADGGVGAAPLVLDLDSFEAGRFSDDDDVLLREALVLAGFEPIARGSAVHGPCPTIG